MGWNSGQDSPVYKSGLCRPRAPTPRKVEALVKEVTFLTRFPTLLLTPRHKERPGTSLWACLCSRQAPPRKIQPWCPALWPLAPPTGVTTASRRCHCRSRPAPRDLSRNTRLGCREAFRRLRLRCGPRRALAPLVPADRGQGGDGALTAQGWRRTSSGLPLRRCSSVSSRHADGEGAPGRGTGENPPRRSEAETPRGTVRRFGQVAPNKRGGMFTARAAKALTRRALPLKALQTRRLEVCGLLRREGSPEEFGFLVCKQGTGPLPPHGAAVRV